VTEVTRCGGNFNVCYLRNGSGSFATLAAIRLASSLVSSLAEGLSMRLDGFLCVRVLSSLNRTRKSVERANSPPVRQALTVRFRGSACDAPSRGDKAKPSVSHIAGGFALPGGQAGFFGSLFQWIARTPYDF
jgi:hypothetical protein